MSEQVEHLDWDRVPEPVIGAIWMALVAWRRADLGNTVIWLGRAVTACPAVPEPVHHAYAAGLVRDAEALNDELAWIATAIGDTKAVAFDFFDAVDEVRSDPVIRRMVATIGMRGGLEADDVWPLCYAVVHRVQRRLVDDE